MGTTQPDGLVERMQSGDLAAFEEFFNTYKRPVYTTALAITRDPFLAEEILQDCFVKAYRVRDRLRTEMSGPSPEPVDADPRISPRELAAFLAGQYADAGSEQQRRRRAIDGSDVPG